MTTITINKQQLQKSTVSNDNTPILRRLKTRYLSYVDKQNNDRIYWYMKAILSIPCVYMIASIMVMAELMDHYEYFVALTMAIFFTNVVVHILGKNSRTFVPIYHISALLFISIPLITYIISKF